MTQNVWHLAAQTIVNAGQIPIPISDTLIELIQTKVKDAYDVDLETEIEIW